MLTERQHQILQFINQYSRENGFPPSVREVGSHFGICPATVQDHLKALERKGQLQRKPFQSRTLKLTSLPPAGAGSVAIPLVGRVAAGAPIVAEQNPEEMIHLPKAWAPAGSFLLKVKGSSMEGAHILDGDYVLVHPRQTAANGEIVVVLIGEEATVKRFYRIRERIVLKAENPRFEPIEIRNDNGDSVRIVGRVVGVLRVMKPSAGSP